MKHSRLSAAGLLLEAEGEVAKQTNDMKNKWHEDRIRVFIFHVYFSGKLWENSKQQGDQIMNTMKNIQRTDDISLTRQELAKVQISLPAKQAISDTL